VRALGLIVSQGETEHMLSALLRLTFNTIYKLLKNHVSSETRAFEVFANNFQFCSTVFWTFLDRFLSDTCYLPKSLYFCDLVAWWLRLGISALWTVAGSNFFLFNFLWNGFTAIIPSHNQILRAYQWYIWVLVFWLFWENSAEELKLENKNFIF